MYPILFKIGPLSIYSYGLFVAAAFLISSFLVLRESEKAHLSKESVLDCLIAILVAGVVGGRLLFVAVNWEYYAGDPLKVFMITEGGMAIHGAIIAAVLAGAVMTRIKGIPFWKGADLIAPYIALGQAIGRIGCLFNGCCYGRVIESGFGIIFPGDAVMKVPTQIYSSLGLLFIYMALRVIGHKKETNGRLFALYLIFYSAFRFFIDFLRGDNPPVLVGLTLAQFISVGILICGIFIYFLRTSKK